MNLDFDVFTYITGIAGLLGLVLQIKDSFPEHRETRKTIVVLVMGIFLGSAIASLKGVKVEFGATITPVQVLVGIFVSVLAIVAIAAAFTKDSMRRSEMFTFTGIGTAALFVLLLFTGMSSVEDGRAEREKQQISFDELLILSDLAASRESFERSLFLLGEAKRRLPLKDERIKVLEQRERDIKAKQVAGK
ncbi:MAG TPA: hypothetical protein VFF26_08090 [Gallionella sp.]|nr:hypothetical protein [Gallionella sp.]